MSRFLEPLPQPFKIPEEEESIRSFWDAEAIFARSVNERPKDKSFVFYEGPPTANGRPGIHHVLGRSFKDVLPRFKTMQGFRVERKAGWDTHGLPVELEVEKELGISGKPQIENLVPGDPVASIAKFNELCRASVWRYKDDWERLTKRMGFWLDLDHPYITFETDYMESVWWILKRIWEQELLFEDFKVVPYCPRCGTALSSHEVALGYQETVDQSLVVKFRVLDQEKTYLLAWTTTPWTLPGNVALAVGQDIEYRIYTDPVSGERYILAEAQAERILGATLASESISREQLLELRYEPLFVIPALTGDTSYRLYEADFVSTEEGTGIVHTAVMYGEDDFRLGTAVGLPKVHTVSEQGTFLDSVVELKDMFVKDLATQEVILQLLRDRNAIYQQTPYTHTYPFCWRCQTPLLYYAKQSWFIRMSALRQALIEQNNTVRWVPEHLKDGRFGEWLREVKDWALSRHRYWGTPLPIWYCTGCNHRLCIGSRAELAQYAKNDIPEDLHRPFVDQVVLQCPECSHDMQRFTEVIDVWFDSGAMPFAQWHYPFENQEKIDAEQSYPADYIAEAIDQTRGWFYTLLAVATLLKKPAPYKTVLSHGHVLDKFGKKMSKSRGNTVNPAEIMDQYGADPLRFYFYALNQPGDPKKFDVQDLEQTVRQVFLITWNIYTFLTTRATTVDWQPTGPITSGRTELLDQWLTARTELLQREVGEATEAIDFLKASRAINTYITELSTWYLRLSRKRSDSDFLPTLSSALRQLSLVCAPYLPFLSESLWQRLRQDTDSVSVHLAAWPTTTAETESDRALLADMQVIQSVVEMGRAARAGSKLKTRQPLASASVTGIRLRTKETQPFIDLIAHELNVKTVTCSDAGSMQVQLDTVLTPALRTEGLARELTRTLQELRKQAQLIEAQPARAIISGTHELSDALQAFQQQIEESAHVTIRWNQEPLQYQREVEGLQVSLEI